MTVVLINPNSTASMTLSALAAARAAAPGVVFDGWTSAEGPPAIEGPDDGAAAVPPLLELVARAQAQGAEAIILACFDDTGLAEAQALADVPVIGIGQAAYTVASLMPGPAAVLTTVAQAVPVIQGNIAAQGWSHIGCVLAADVPVLALDAAPAAAADRFVAAAAALPPGTRTLILGCAGAVTITQRVSARLPYRIIDGVTAAARLTQAIAPA